MKVTNYLLPPRVKTLFKSATSLWMSSRVSEFLVIDEKNFRHVFLEHIFHIWKWNQKKSWEKRFRLIIFLIDLKFTWPNLPCQSLQDSIFKATGAWILLSQGYIKSERPSLTIYLPMNTLFLKITNLLDSLTNLYPVLKRLDSLIRFLQRVGTCKMP